MTTPPSIYHAYLRPSILQILRATGYHSTRPAVLDSLTDLAARYLSLLCEKAAQHAAHNRGDGHEADFDIADVRMALQDVGALLPERVFTAQEWAGEEDTRGVDEYIKWFSGQRMKEILEGGSGDAESEATDYLGALMKKHNRSNEDSKYQGTIFGKTNDVGETQVLVEGGPEMSINEWIAKRSNIHPANEMIFEESAGEDRVNGLKGRDSRSPSSGLSSVGDRLGDDDVDVMDITS